MKPCPECGGVMEKQTGVIDEPIIRTGTGGIARKARPATFYACTECEHCQEK